MPTQAGLPIFDDENDEVSWLRARDEPAPPPPPFEEPPERPLFADEARKPRYARPDTGPGGRARRRVLALRPRRSTGSGLIPAVDELDDTREQVPGRSWLRLAMLVAVGAGAAWSRSPSPFNLGRGKTPLGTEPDDDEPTPRPRRRSTAPAAAPDAVHRARWPTTSTRRATARRTPTTSRAPSTATRPRRGRTLTYKQQLGPAGLKRGVGLVVDLGQARAVRRVDLTLVGPADRALALPDRRPCRPTPRSSPRSPSCRPAAAAADGRPRRRRPPAATSRSGSPPSRLSTAASRVGSLTSWWPDER